MKYILVCLSAFMMSNAVFAQEDAITKFFSKYMQDDRFENVFISAQMMGLLGGNSKEIKDDKELQQILNGLNGLRILTCESASAKQFFDEANSTIAGKGFESLMTIKDKEDAVTFLTKKGPSGISELLLMTCDGKEFLLLSITGKIDLQKISQLSKSLNIGGLETLQQLDKKSSGKK